ncbi:MAG: hypothetical protein RLZZ324_578 [Candidatus Parcubacteria bacterium]|jgi:hypothetical protein
MNAKPHNAYGAALRAFAVTATLLAVAFVLTRSSVPEGRLSTDTAFDGPAPYLSEPKPSERVGDAVSRVNETLRPLLDEPVYVDLRPPAPFKDARVTLRFAATSPIVDVAAQSSAPDRQFTVRTVKHALLDSLASAAWTRVSDGGLSLYQRRPVYKDMASFLAHPPAQDKIAAWHAEPPSNFRLPGYAPSSDARGIMVSLRGSHRLLTYVKGEPLSFTFVLQDMNRESGADATRAAVYALGASTPLASAALGDDGDVSDDQKSSGLRELTVTLPAPAEGAYRVALATTDDVFIREIRTRQSRIVFEDHLFLGDHVGYSPQTPPFTAYASGTRLAARTPHAESTQTLVVGGAPLLIDQPVAQVSTSLFGSTPVAVTAPKRDVILETDGLFALSASDWFDPLPFRLGPSATRTELDARGIDFALAAYQPGVSLGGITEASAVFPFADLARTPAGAYRFAVSVPGNGGQAHAGVDVAGMSFLLTRDIFGADGFWAAFRGAAPARDDGDARTQPFGLSFDDKVE